MATKPETVEVTRISVRGTKSKTSVSVEAVLIGTKAKVVQRAKLKYRYRYSVYCRARGLRNANWSHTLSTDDWNTAAGSANHWEAREYRAMIVDNGDPDKRNGA